MYVRRVTCLEFHIFVGFSPFRQYGKLSLIALVAVFWNTSLLYFGMGFSSKGRCDSHTNVWWSTRATEHPSVLVDGCSIDLTEYYSSRRRDWIPMANWLWV